MLRRYFLVCCFAVIPAIATAADDIVVIVNQKAGVNKLSRDEVINIFLGRMRPPILTNGLRGALLGDSCTFHLSGSIENGVKSAARILRYSKC